METESILERRDGETDLQYHKRLLTAKLIDKTLDLDYATLSPYLYGKEYAPDVARRMAYGSVRTLNLVEQELMNEVEADTSATDKAISELDQKIADLQKEQQKFRDQRREYNKLITSQSRLENLFRALTISANGLEQSIGNMYDDIIFCNEAVDNSDSEAVLVFSDWHYGLVTNNIFNKYNKDICKQRVQDVVRSAAERIALHSCKRLYVIGLGDFFHGAIHTSARVASEELVCDQIMEVSEILAQSICNLSQIVDETIVAVNYGNHGRTVQKKEDNIHRDNMERLIPWWLKQRLAAHDNITVLDDFDNEFVFLEVAGHEFCCVHGDLDSVKGSPRMLATLFNKQYGKDIEYILLGDKHHRESYEELGVTAMLCGSLAGTDDYANDKRLYSSPSQLLLIVRPDIGVDAEYRISCI